MAVTVKLYDQARRVADEICNIRTHRNLTTKAKTVNPMRLDVTP